MKFWSTATRLHDAISQKAIIFSTALVHLLANEKVSKNKRCLLEGIMFLDFVHHPMFSQKHVLETGSVSVFR
jgi:hypothetical protein